MKSFSPVLTGLAFAITCLFFTANESRATEYDLTAYFASPDIVAKAIGSNDADLKARLLQMTDFVKQQGLDERFGEAGQWKVTIDRLVAGQQRENAGLNSYALWMLLKAVAEEPDDKNAGPPFANLHILTDYFSAAGAKRLSDFLKRIDEGNIDEPSTGLPDVLKGKLGPTDYYAQLSVISPEDADLFLKELRKIVAEAETMIQLGAGEENQDVLHAKAAMRAVATKNFSAYYASRDKDSLEGKTVEEAVMAAVEQEMSEPYQYTQNVEALAIAVPTIRSWLRKAIAEKKHLFLIYETF